MGFKLKIVLFFSLFIYCFVYAQQTKIDSLEHLLKTASKTKEASIYIELSKLVQDKSNPNENPAVAYLEEAKKRIDIEKDKRLYFQYLSIIARQQLYAHEINESLETTKKALDLGYKEDSSELIELYKTIAIANYYLGKFSDNIKANLKALHISDSLHIEKQKPYIYNSLAVAYIAMEDFTKAEKNLYSALEYGQKQDNKSEASRARGNLAIVYAQQGKFDLSEQWFRKEIAYLQQVGDSIYLSAGYNNLGRLFEMKGNLNASYKNYQIALDIAKKTVDSSSVAIGYQNVGLILGKLGNKQDAITNFNKGLEMSRSIGNRTILRDGLFNMSQFYEGIDNSKKALSYYKDYHALNDSIIGKEQLQAVRELETKYETEKKEKEIIILSEQKLKNEILINQQRNQMKWLVVIGIVVAILALLVFLVYKQRAANKKQLELINAIEDTQTAERKRIAQDLHDSVGGSLALLKNKIRTVVEHQDSPSKELLSTLQTVEKTSNDVRQIAHNLMPSELIKFGLVSAIQSILDQLNSEELKAQLYAHNMEQRIDTVKEVHLFRITQEVIQNVLKHAKAKNLTVYLNKYAKHLSLMVEDDGDGFVENTNEGLGINGIKQRVEQLKGSLNIDSSSGRGTTFNIQIPV